MKIKGVNLKLSALFALVAYYGFAYYLPNSHSFFCIGGLLRRWLCHFIFKKMGKNVNVERKANFGSGRNIEIGDNSGLGIRCSVPSNTKIGANVMMGPNCYILGQNHTFDRTDIPMINQGYSQPANPCVIDDDVWIGRNVTMTPGRHISKGSIIGACCVLTKDFPEYSVVGGNPSKLIRSRLN